MYVPQHDGSSDVSGREAASIGPEREARNGAGVIVELSKQPVAVDVPQLDGAIGARGRQDGPVGTERDAVDRAGVGPECRAELPSAWRVPEANRAASASRGDGTSIGLNATLSTMRTSPLSVPDSLARRRSHNWTVPFSVAVARLRPLGLKATLLTGPA
jgi:hypothetical protein